MKRTIKVLSVFVMASLMAKAETNLVITHLDATEKVSALSVVGKISFEGDDMYLYSNTNEVLAKSPISSVRKITFTEGASTEVASVKDRTLTVYPNPTKESIHIDGLEEGEIVRIFDMNGRIIKKTDSGKQTIINVSNLNKGTYLLQIGTEILKFIKD